MLEAIGPGAEKQKEIVVRPVIGGCQIAMDRLEEKMAETLPSEARVIIAVTRCKIRRRLEIRKCYICESIISERKQNTTKKLRSCRQFTIEELRASGSRIKVGKTSGSEAVKLKIEHCPETLLRTFNISLNEGR